MNITVLNGSPHSKGKTKTMIEAFTKGAVEAGHQVIVIEAGQKHVHGCLGCGVCFTNGGTCVQQDDMGEILAQLDQTDLVVFASPIYWFDITAQLKAVIDRMYARGKVGFHFHKTILLLDSGADGVYDAAIAQYKATTAYLHWKDLGIITIPGMAARDSMQTSPLLSSVYELGKSLS